MSIHPSSALYHRHPEWVVYHELVATSREYMRQVTAVEPRWLVAAAPTFFRLADPATLAQRRAGEALQPLYNRFEAAGEWRLTKRVRAPARPSQAFVSSGSGGSGSSVKKG